VEDEPALFVEVRVEEIERRVVILADDGTPVASARLAGVRAEIGLEAVFVLVLAEELLAPDVLEDRRSCSPFRRR
jgi:hypothetical protein